MGGGGGHIVKCCRTHDTKFGLSFLENRCTPPPPLHQASSDMGDEVGREKIEGSKMFSFQESHVVDPNFCGGSEFVTSYQ